MAVFTLHAQTDANSANGAETVKLFCDEDRLSWGAFIQVVVVIGP